MFLLFCSSAALAAGQVSFGAATRNAAEADGTLQLQVTRTGSSLGPLVVQYGTRDGTAAAGADYTQAAGTLSWNDGEGGSKSIAVAVTPDARIEANETFRVVLSNPIGGALGATPAQTVTVLDDDSRLYFVDETVLIRESDGQLRFSVQREGSRNTAASVAYQIIPETAVPGSDYQPVHGRLSWNAGDGSAKTISVPVISDTAKEAGETFVVRLSGVQGARIDAFEAVGTILNDDGDGCIYPAGSTAIFAWAGTIGSDVQGLNARTRSTAFQLLGGCTIDSMSVQVKWSGDADDIDLDVTPPSGPVVTSGGLQPVEPNSETVTIPAPAVGTYTATVKSYTNQQVAFNGTVTVAIGSTLAPLTACQQAYQGFGAAPALLGPSIPVGSAAELILSFADIASRDAGLRQLAQTALLSAEELDTVHAFAHLPIFTFSAGRVTSDLLARLRADLAPYRLGSIWSNASIPLNLDTSTAYIEAPQARQFYELSGRGIGVAIIDSGIDTTQGDFANVVDNRKFVGTVGIATPYGDTSSGHGTHVAGTVGGTGASSNGRWKGVAPGATLLGYGNGDGRSVFLQSAIAAYDRMLDVRELYNARITNNSFGGAGAFNRADPLMVAVKQAYDAGIISVFSGGNDGPNNGTLSSYAGPCTISVANGDRNGHLSGDSSRGTPDDPGTPGSELRTPTITAPGSGITAPRGTTGAITPPRADNPRYSTISGTSMASPHIAGVIALMLEANPTLSFEQVVEILQSTARPMSQPTGLPYAAHEVGAGYVDTLAAVAAALGEDEPVLPPPTVTIGPGTSVVRVYNDTAGTAFAPFGAGGCLGCPGEPDGTKGPHRYQFKLPASLADVQQLDVRVDWDSLADWMLLEVINPDGSSAGTSNFIDTNYQELSIAAPAPGIYVIEVTEEVTAGSSFSVTVSLVRGGTASTVTVPLSTFDPTPDPAACADGLDNDGDSLIDHPADPGCASAADTDETNAAATACADGLDNDGDGATDFPADTGCSAAADDDETNTPPPPPSGARVVVAVIDSAINPYHAFYYSQPVRVTQELVDAFGAQRVTLTRDRATFAENVTADTAFWSSVERGKSYYFEGTNIIARSEAAAGLAPLLPVATKSEHGVGTSSAMLTANPDAVLLFIETEGALGNDAAQEYAFTHPEVDIVSTSYGFQDPVLGTPLPLPLTYTYSFEGVVENGKLHFSAAGNGNGLTPLDPGAGAWWGIGVSGIEEYSSDGDTQLFSNNVADFVADYTQDLPYCMECMSGTNEFTAGTSFSTPQAAGVASKVILEARRMVGHQGGINPATRNMAEGRSFAISNWKVRRALEQAARIPDVLDYDPIEGVLDLGATPVNPVAPWLQVGWGDLSYDPAKGVVNAALSHLNLLPASFARVKDAGFCEFQTHVWEARYEYWGFVDGKYAPGDIPFIFCESATGLNAPNDDGGHPQDSDGDGTVDQLE